jgi:hypothetical protein
MEVLGITDIRPLLSDSPSLDPATALDEVTAWIALRSPSEVVQREPAAERGLSA